jgi:hypothetical protein
MREPESQQGGPHWNREGQKLSIAGEKLSC